MSSSARPRGRRLPITLILVLGIAAIFGWRFHVLGQDESRASLRSVQEEQGMPVEVTRLDLRDLERWMTLAGTVKGSQQSSIVSTNTLRVVEVVRREGERVRAGDVILRLQSDAPNPMLHSAARARAVYEDALRDAERMRALFEEGAISRQALDKAEMSLEVAASDLNDARGGTELVAPHAGILTRMLVEEGDMASSGAPLATIARTDTVRIVFEAGSQQALSLAVGQPAIWQYEGRDGGEGILSQLDLMADPHTHLLEGEATFANPEGRLLPGLLVSFRVQVLHQPGAATLPVGCLLETEDGPAVYAVEEEDGRPVARLRAVELGIETSDQVEIRDGLPSGAQVVRFGQSKLSDGMPVRLIPLEEDA